MRALSVGVGGCARDACALAAEYTRRFGKVHGCEQHLAWLATPPETLSLSASHNPYELELATVHAPVGCAGAPLCMGDAVDECRFETPDGVDLTTSYEAYYIRKAEHIRMRWSSDKERPMTARGTGR